MFNSTHTLLGIALARAGLNAWTPWATVAATVAANLPDIDVITAYYGAPVYLANHRGFTHSIPGVLLLSFGLAILIYFLNAAWIQCRGPLAARVRFKPLLAVITLSMLTHPLLDYTNAYGTRVLLPFSTRWYAWDIVYVVSPYLDAGLFCGVLLSFWRPHHSRRFGVGALLFVVAFWVVCTISHDRAQRVLSASTVHGEQPIAVAAFPTAWNPFVWSSVFETPMTMYKVRVSAWDSPGDLPALAAASKILPTPEVAIRQSLNTYAVRVFLDFARFPVSKLENGPDGYRVLWMDFRSYDPDYQVGFSAAVWLSPTFEILDEDFSYRRRVAF